MKRPIAVAAALLLAAGAALAQTDKDLAEGEVRKIDRPAAKLTIQHGPLATLDMPAMTMAFKVQDPKMLDQLQPGSKIRFRAERVNGSILVTQIDKAE